MNKKVASLLALALISTASLFAWENAGSRSVHSLGLNVIVNDQEYQEFPVDGYKYNLEMTGLGFNFFYNHLKVGDNRFSSFIDCQFGYGSREFGDMYRSENEDAKSDSGLPSVSGFDTRFTFGLGMAPVNTDNLIVTIHGTAGFLFDVFTGEENGQEWSFGGFDSFIGANLQASYKISEVAGITGGLHVYTDLFGITNLVDNTNDITYDDGALTGGFNLDSKIGIAFIY